MMAGGNGGGSMVIARGRAVGVSSDTVGGLAASTDTAAGAGTPMDSGCVGASMHISGAASIHAGDAVMDGGGGHREVTAGEGADEGDGSINGGGGSVASGGCSI
jgi:hypothetical protein